MSDHGPVVSVIMPVCNGAAYLRDSIGSVLSQHFQDWELIVIDDGSEDDSHEIVATLTADDPRTLILRQENRGVTLARNRGIEVSRGSLIAFLDQDDRWTADALERQVGAHSADANAGYSIAMQRCFLEPGVSVPTWFRLQKLQEPGLAYLPGTMVVKRETFDEVGVFDPRYPISSDADWFARARDRGVAELRIEAVLLERRIHRENQSQQAQHIHSELFDVLHASIRRKRAGDAPR